MRLRHIKNSENIIKTFSICLNEENCSFPLDKKSVFNNDNPIYLELGMGKGKFIIKNALNNTNINYIGIEKYATVILYALKTYDLYKNNLDINNLRMMCIDIKNIEDYFLPNTIDKIFLNFSDPWPKKRHEDRRLTSSFFLEKYKKLLKKDATIEFKTDNLSLFEYSLDSLTNNNYKIIYKTYDLHNDIVANVDNIQTEYEEKFSEKGQKIYKLITTP